MNQTKKHLLELNEVELVRRARDGDAEAVGALYDRHHEQIFRYVWSRVDNQHLAEDLTGEIFTRMVVNLPRYRLAGVPFRAWLYRIAYNLIMDHYRTENGRSPLPLQQAHNLSHDGQNPATIIETKLTIDRVRRALAQLDPAQRDVVELRFLAGMPLREVAATLDKSVAAIKSTQHRGLKALRLALQQG